jgi:hypothetical protein
MLIPSKLSRPVRLEHTVVRERLLAKLSGANNYRVVAFVQRKPPKIVFTCGPLRNERCFTVPGRTGDLPVI